MALVEPEISLRIAAAQNCLHLLIIDQLVVALRGRQINLADALPLAGAVDQAGDDRQ